MKTPTRTRPRRPWLLLGAVALAFLLTPYVAQADEKYWVGTSGEWNDPSHWSTTPGGSGGAAPPQDGDEVFLIQSDNTTRLVTYKIDPPSRPPELGGLRINASGAYGFMILFQGIYDHPLVSSAEYVGGYHYPGYGDVVSGRGFHLQSGGSNYTKTFLTIGDTPGSLGYYSLSGGTLDNGTTLTVGNEGTGSFSQSDGCVYTTYFQNIGFYGTGIYSQSGGINMVGAALRLGYRSSASGTYELSGTGFFSAPTQYIGYEGVGHFKQDGGYNENVTLSIGQDPGSSGVYELSKGILSTQRLFVGWQGNGKFIHDGGTNIVANLLYVGCTKASIGVYELGSSVVSRGVLRAHEEVIGLNGTSTGTFNHTFGTNIIATRLILGFGQFSSGSYFLGYQGELEAASQYIGWYGAGSFTQFWAANNVKDNLYLGFQATGSGTYDLMSHSQLYAANQYIGYEGIGHFTQTGGNNRVYNKLFLAWSSSSTGTYLLGGGALQIDGSMEVGTGGTFTQTGGTLKSGPLNNAGTVNFAGGNVDVGHITNKSSGHLNISTDLTLGSADNYGVIKTTGATVVWQGIFLNAGAYISDPSTQTFADLEVTPTGYLVGYSQDLFVVRGDLKVHSAQHFLWKTDQATLQFVSDDVDNLHDFYVPGADRGPGGGSDNFKWGTLILGEFDERGNLINGQTVHFFDGNPRNLGTALYLGKIEGLDYDPITLMVANLLGFEGLNIYYDPFFNPYLGGLTYNLTRGGHLVATPLPASVLLLGSGLLGLGLLGWRKKRG